MAARSADAEMATRKTVEGRHRSLPAMVDRRTKNSNKQRRSQAKSLPNHLKYVKKHIASLRTARHDMVKQAKAKLIDAAYERLIGYRKTAGFSTEVDLLAFISHAKKAFPVASDQASRFSGST